MKRIGTAFLALVMALSCVGPALAAEESPDYEALQAQLDALHEQIDALYEQAAPLEEQLMERYADYYEIYGDMDDWDEATWELSDTWTDAEWEGYWFGMDNGWGYDLSAEKAEMGMPFPQGINVRVNGSYLDAAPIALEGVTYLSADVLLAALGLDGTDVETVELDGVACLPIRAVAETNGYEVDWDGWYQVVELDNWALLAADIDEEFTVLNTLLRASLNTVDPAKTYASKGTVKYAATLYGEEKDDTAGITVNLDALVKGDYSALSAKYDIRTDLTDLEDLIVQFGGQEALDAAKALNGSMEVRLDGQNGGMYFKSDLFSKLGADYLPEGKWMGMEDAGFAQAYTEIMGQIREMTVGSLLVMSVKDSRRPYETLDEMLPVLKLLAGDDLFTTTKSGSTTTYTCKMDMVKLVTRAATLGLFTAEDIGGLFGQTGIPTAGYQLTAKVKDDKLTGLTAKGKLTWSVLSLEFDVDSTDTRSESYVALKGRYIGKLELTASSTVKTTTQTVPGAPDGFLDYEAVMEDYYQSLYGNYEW